MPLSFSQYLDLVNSGIYRQRAKIQLLRYSDLSVYREIQGDILNNSGSLSIERKNGIRRTCSFSLINSTVTEVGKYIPSIKNLFFSPRQPIRLWLGLADENGEEYLISNGIYFLSDPNITSNASESVVELSMSDPFSIFNGDLGGTLSATHIVTLASNIYNTIDAILQTENFYPLPSILDSIYDSEITPFTLTTEAGNNYGEILEQLSYMISANIFFNRDGQLTVMQDINDAIKGSVFDFTTESAQYLGGTNKFNYPNFYNSVLVIGSNSNSGVIYKYEATDTNLSSPFSVNNIGFKRQKLIEDPNLDSNQKCEDLAKFLLKRYVAIQNEVSITSIPLYHLDVDQICTLTDANLGFNKERFLINSIQIPFNIGGEMTINCVKAIDLPFNDA